MSINLEMWQYLFDLDISGLSSSLVMIRENLPFDNPGILSSIPNLSPSETQINRNTIESCNEWLVHQYMYILSEESFINIFDDNLELQRTILAAANLKQPWLFLKLLRKYIEIAKKLSSPDLQLPVEITSFRQNELTVKEIYSPVKYSKICLQSHTTVLRVLKFCVLILERFISDLIILDSGALKLEVINTVLDIYQHSPFTIKVICLKCIYRFFKSHDMLKDSSLQLFVHVLHITGLIFRGLATRNPPTEELDTFDKTLMKLFEVIRIQEFSNGRNLSGFLSLVLGFQESYRKVKYKFEHFPVSFSSIVRILFEQKCEIESNRETDEAALLDFSSKDEANRDLWIYTIYLRAACDDTAVKDSPIWKEILRRVNSRNPETISEILEQVLQMTSKFPQLTLECDYQELVTTVFTRMTEQLRNTTTSLPSSLTLIQRMLSVKDANQLDDRQQQQLFDSLVYGLEDMLELKFRPHSGIYQEFYDSQKQLRTGDTELLILDLVANLQTDGLRQSTKNKLRLLIESVMKRSCSSSLSPVIVENFIKRFPVVLKQKHVPFDEKVNQFLQLISKRSENDRTLASILSSLICLAAGQSLSTCDICCRTSPTDEPAPMLRNGDVSLLEMFRKYLVHDDLSIQLAALDAVKRVAKHYPEKFVHLADLILDTFIKPKPELLQELAPKLHHIHPVLNLRQVLLEQTISKLLSLLKASLETPNNQSLQLAVLRVIREFGLYEEFNLQTYLRMFKLLLIYLMHEESYVVSEAMLALQETCLKRKFNPRNMFNWFTQSILELIVPLIVSMYLRKDICITDCLRHTSKLFEYRDTESFIYDNHALLLAHLLPFVVKHQECEEILKDICEGILQQDVNNTLASVFFIIYIRLFLNEPDEIHQEVGAFITDTTGRSVYELLKLSDKNVALFLTKYHQNPQCVTNTFKGLLSMKNNNQECSLTQIVEYVYGKFLGVLKEFEMNLIGPDKEKSIKRDVLLSLGEIIRLMGAKYITPFRFQIVSLLRTAVSLNETDLHGICVQVWDIFLRTVDVPLLGSLLSTIVVSIEPLLQKYNQEVNNILRYLIISNGNLLSSHLKDLFFLESLNVDAEVKQFIVQHNHMNAKDGDSFERLFLNYSNQINHDNMAVRIYGIKYLTELFRGNRSKVNKLIMGQPIVDDQMEATLRQLIHSCNNVEENLRVAAGICVGEIGAIEPSYLQQNYAPQKKFCASVLDTGFAIATLADLCHAYQFQKDSKHVDSFSLAIQNILQYHCVNPKQGEQMEIWTAIPERMRQMMEPLLTSNYTHIRMKNYHERHPVFPSRTCSDWVHTWATNIIEHIENADIKRLLHSFKPSLKNDDHIMATLMPYIILHGLQYSAQDRREKIKEEFEVIFKMAATTIKRHDISGASTLQVNIDEAKQVKEIPMLSFVPLDFVDDTEEDNSEDVKEKCAKLAFNLVDFLGNWCSEYRQKHYKDLSAKEYKIVSEFLQAFDNKTMAQANFNCGEYARALQLMEKVVVKNPEQLQSELSFLGQIYAELLDSDSLEGAMSLKTINLTLPEQILLNNVTGKLHESATCYERMIQEKEMGVYDMKDMVQCYLGLDQPETALLICEGLMEKLYLKHAKDIPNEIAAEPLWRLGRFEEVQKTVNRFQLQDSANWGVRCGQVLNCLHLNHHENFAYEVRKAREMILKSLRLTEIGENSYTKGYGQVLKLHLITEIEMTFGLCEAMQKENFELAPKQLDSYFGEMAERLKMFKNRKNIQEILCLRRILFNELNALLANNCPFKDTLARLQKTTTLELGKSWIASAKVARKTGAVQQAGLYILNCERYGMKDLFLEKAKLLWEKGDQTIAIQTLNRGMEHLLQVMGTTNFKDLQKEERVVFAKGKFLLASFNAQAMNIQTDLNVQHFKDSLLASKESEICYVHYAQFLDKIYENTAVSRKMERFELLREVMTNYGNSMLYGFKYIYQSMPRMLSIWLDYTADKFTDAKSSAALTKVADGFSEKLPAFMFFTAFSQLVSRICHPSQDVYNVLKTILVKLVLCFPQQSLWMLLCVLKSSYASRERKCAMVFDDRRLQSAGMKKLINDFNILAIRFIDLAKAEIQKGVSKTTVSALVRDLPRIISDHNFSSIIVPCEQYMQPILPSPLDRSKPVDAYVPFPQAMAYISGIDDEVLLLQSLQRPRRVSFKASDGLSYKLLLKPKDDLRRDFRLMEFNNVVKHYLNLDLETRERRLNIRTYGVLPLNEEYGIIEWLDNLQTFRQILNVLYRQNKKGMSAQELTPFYQDGIVPLHRAKDRFLNILLKRHPPVFDQWFRNNFTTSHNWYMARTAYVRTCGVMSIVGYILGLGDRHCENVLFDVTNGEVVHVDFNCLFNAGETFNIPERVPFRLTHNMVHAMGPLGIEGPFKKTCEVTMRVLRAQQQTLMSVIRPFIYDPLVTWKKTVQADGSSERTDSDAMNNVQNIEDRLKGFVKIEKKKSNMPLSTEGQVNFLIKEATDLNNVALMYTGWCPFM